MKTMTKAGMVVLASVAICHAEGTMLKQLANSAASLFTAFLINIGVFTAPAPQPSSPPIVKRSIKISPQPAGPVHRFLYRFEGRAVYRGSPVIGAKVLVRINSSTDAQVQNVTTGPDGQYAAEFQVAATDYEPINWSMEGYTSDLRKVKLMGQRIVMKEDEPVRVVNTPLELALAESDNIFPKAIF